MILHSSIVHPKLEPRREVRVLARKRVMRCLSRIYYAITLHADIVDDLAGKLPQPIRYIFRAMVIMRVSIFFLDLLRAVLGPAKVPQLDA